MDNKMSEPADRKFAAEVIRLAGGRDNIERVFHCAVRLRLVLKEPELAQRRRLEKVKPVKGVFLLDGQLQLVIGLEDVDRLCGVLQSCLETGPDLVKS
ncbi:PTS transporter subunit EIIB [Lachnotalea sp. AF33-28]|uniref:PTS transporter subunit EIIB n=1 Tax=Lachnotalea sp. AF33-28 TaxID=2292046 RepID=UPI000E54AC44|nr:PTS transporter subunit EIIB [Lachnotalea sp. AF33-28]RHP31223.1 PTS sucrose transporter subunit IIBC [Lachnotalea sp. AF33-28]